jgi:CheY-like chemotaxis protein
METPGPHAALAILVVDDNPADVYFIQRVLERHGFTSALQVLENRHQTLAFFDHLAREEHPRCPDVLLLDLYLPGLDSGALLHGIKTIPACAGMRIIILTGSDDPVARTEAMTLGADAFFHKPLSFQAYLELGEIIKAVLGGAAPGNAAGAAGV